MKYEKRVETNIAYMFKLKNKTYYFWFYLEAEWKDKVKRINWSDFTYQQIIDQLKIRY